MSLSPVSQKLYATLIEHHALVRAGDNIKQNQIDRHLITYGSLCDQAGVSGLTRGVGKFLGEIAEYCSDRGWPPINALAVNSETRMPGENYDLAEGCSLLKWPKQVIAVLKFQHYEHL